MEELALALPTSTFDPWHRREGAHLTELTARLCSPYTFNRVNSSVTATVSGVDLFRGLDSSTGTSSIIQKLKMFGARIRSWQTGPKIDDRGMVVVFIIGRPVGAAAESPLA